MEIRLDPGGAATVMPGTFSHGQGHETVYAQMVAEWLAIDFDKIRVIQGDTDDVSFGRGTFAARSMAFGGSALRLAVDQSIERARNSRHTSWKPVTRISSSPTACLP